MRLKNEATKIHRKRTNRDKHLAGLKRGLTMSRMSQQKDDNVYRIDKYDGDVDLNASQLSDH